MTATRSEYREERRAEVLRSVVHAFIVAGEPVSSRSIAAALGQGLSSATVRNVMAELEDLGFLVQPHTSAGRIPTEKAYRQYAELLIHDLEARSGVAAGEAEPNGIFERTGDLADLLLAASRALAERCGCLGMVLRPQISFARFHIAQFLRLDRSRVVAVVVGEEGVVTDKVVQVDTDYSQGELDRISNYLTNRFRGGTLMEVRRALERELKEERAACDQALRRSLSFALDALGRCAVSGEIYLEAPSAEDSEVGVDSERVRQMLRAYGEKDRIAALLARCIEREGIQVLIGADADSGEETCFPGMALIAVRYGDGDRPLGTVGVMGSSRMRYEQVIPLVDRVARDVGAAIACGLGSTESAPRPA